MKTLKNGYIPFPNNTKNNILNGEKTTTIRPDIPEIQEEKTFKAIDFEEKTFAKIKITKITPYKNNRLLITFKVITN